MSTAARSQRFFAEGFSSPFDEAIAFFRQKLNLPTKTWRSIDGKAHDRALVIAGATKENLIADIRSAIDDAIAKGESYEQFRKRFEEIVAKHGWTGWKGEGSEKGRAWRARVIYDTNIRTAYAAGRYAQMKDPDVVKAKPYWLYRHAHTRTPLKARAAHLALDGMVFAHDDPVWDEIYPPNGWNCTCGVVPLSKRELKNLGKDEPDTMQLDYERVGDPGTGEVIRKPKLVELGWDHAPGKTWAEGLVPPQLQNPLRPSSSPALKPTLDLPLPSIAKPFTQPLMKPGLAPEKYIDAFLNEFGAKRGEPKLWRDPSGHVVTISDDLFRRANGALKLMEGTRNEHVMRLAEALKDPDEIWVDWADPRRNKSTVVRRYLRISPDSPEFALFTWSVDGWAGTTAFNPETGKKKEPNPDYLERFRIGALLWRRPEK